MASLFTSPAPDRAPDLAFSHRKAAVTLHLRDDDGAPLADCDVTVQQRRHAFGFGCIGFELIDWIDGVSEDPDHDAVLADRWLDLFDTVTLPFYWGRFEPVQGQPTTQRIRAAAQWFAERGVRTKGHPLVWHTVGAPWLLEKEPKEVERLLRDRIQREVSDFSGLIDTWDAINEAVIMPVFAAEDNAITRLARQKGRVEMMRIAFEEARTANPAATLLLNDFDMSTAYECLIEAALEAGIRIDRLGLQSHMHQGAWGEEKTAEVLERFSRFNISLHFTETTVLSGDPVPEHIEDLNEWQVRPEQWPSTEEGEARQADEAEAHYRRLFAHPAVESITYWGLPDRRMWLNAPGGLLRRDGTPKPAYERLRRLIRHQWWMEPTTLRTDDAGRLPLEGFLGEYEISTARATARIELGEAGQLEQSVPLTAHH